MWLCNSENNILGDFYEGLMDGIIPQLELISSSSAGKIYQMQQLTKAMIQTETYQVTGSRIEKGV